MATLLWTPDWGWRQKVRDLFKKKKNFFHLVLDRFLDHTAPATWQSAFRGVFVGSVGYSAAADLLVVR